MPNGMVCACVAKALAALAAQNDCFFMTFHTLGMGYHKTAKTESVLRSDTQLELIADKREVFASKLHKFVMCAALMYFAICHVDDKICVSYCR